MSELPSLALVVVLKHLPIGDLVQCRRVNKLWRHLIDHSISKSELILFVECAPRLAWWVHRGGEAIHLENAIQANYALFDPETFFGLFKRVRRMFLCFNNFFFKQEWAEKFASHFGATLEHLQIDYEATTSLSESTTDFRLDLPNLQTFCFSNKTRNQDFDRPFAVRVNSDRLTHLYATNVDFTLRSDSIIARMAPNLRELFVGEIIYEDPIEFPNLQRLGCRNPPSSEFLTSCLPSLREFYFPNKFLNNLNENGESIQDFLWQNKSENRNLDVFWFGMRFTTNNLIPNLYAVSQIDQRTHTKPVVTAETPNYFEENRSIFNFYHLRYSGQYSIYYSDSFTDRLNENVDREMIDCLRASLDSVFMWNDESCLKSKFDVPKLAHLFQFISRAELGDISDRQHEYDQLPTIFPNLRILTLYLKMPNNCDHSFLSRFKSLFSLHLTRALSHQVLDQILTNCQFLYYLTVFLEENREKCYHLRRGYKHIREPEKLFDVRFPSIDSEAIFFKEKEMALEYLDRNQLSLDSKVEP